MLQSRKVRMLVDTTHKLLRRGALGNVQKIVVKSHAADIAILFRSLSSAECVSVFNLIRSRTQRAELVSELDAEIATRLMLDLGADDAAKVLREMSSDDAADVLGAMPPELAAQILESMHDEDQEAVEGLMRYAEDTAGGIMVPDFFALREDVTAEEAIDALRNAGDVEMAFYVYVVNEFEQLVGVVSLRQLVMVSSETKLKSVMETNLVSVRPDTDQEEVARLVARYNYLALPVVDDANKLLGIVTVDDIIDVIQEEAAEDMLRMAGAGEEVAEGRTVGTGVRARGPWLVATFVGGLVAALVVRPFLPLLATHLELVLFLPLILALCGIAGTQSATIVVSAMSIGVVEAKHFWHVVRKELLVGLVLGLAYGTVSGALAGLGTSMAYGLVVGLAVVGSVIVAAIVGGAFPLLLDRLHLDPTIAAGPAVAAGVDLIGVAVYLALATALLPVAGA